MEYINYIVILIIVLVLYILCKTLHKSFNQLVRKGEDFLNLEDELGIYHNNVESHMRSEGYEQDSAPTTTHHLKEMQGLINNNHIKLEKVTNTSVPYYQLSFDKPTTVYGLFMKTGYTDQQYNSNSFIFEIKYSTNFADKQAFIPLLDQDNAKKTITLNANVGHNDAETIMEEKEFPVPITAKHIRVYNLSADHIDLTIDAIIKPLNYLSLKLYDVKQINTKIKDNGKHIDNKVNIEETLNYVSHVDDQTPLKPYSDKLGRREIFKFDVRTPHFNFNDLNIRNKPSFDAYIIRSARGVDNEFCQLNSKTKEIYCNTQISKPNVLLRFNVVNSDSENGSHTMVVQHFKSGLYADKNFKFIVKSSGDAQKYIVDKHTTSSIKKIFNLDDYIDKKEEVTNNEYNQCQEHTVYYINIHRPYNDYTLQNEHTKALINRNNKLPKELEHIPETSADTQEGIYIDTIGTDIKDIKFKIKKNNKLSDVGARYRYKKLSSSSTNKKLSGPYCTNPTIDKPEYIYNSVMIYKSGDTPETVIEVFDPSIEKYKPELYEGMSIGTKYVAEIKKHTPISLKNYTPEIIKICIPNKPNDLMNGNILREEFKINTKMFNVVDKNGNTMDLEFTVQNEHINSTTCNDSSIINNMYKIIKKPSNNYYELVSPNDPKYNNIDCNLSHDYVVDIMDNDIIDNDKDTNSVYLQNKCLF